MRETKKKESILKKKGIFITLTGLISVAVIALVMNLILVKEEQNQSFDEEAWEEALRTSAETELYQEEAQEVSGTILPEIPAEETISEAVETAVEPPEPSVEEPKAILMEKPVPGGITKDYSPEELVYSDTMQDWRVHEGIDFAAEEKASVAAVADGTVEKVIQDGLFGACLVISHPDGIQTFYGNLEEDSMPAVGTQVKTGQTIGKVGKTATVEINDTPHLHFEVRKDGKPVNPHEFLGDTVTDDE